MRVAILVLLCFTPLLTYAQLHPNSTSYYDASFDGVTSQFVDGASWKTKMATCTVEIWHPVHGQFETRAPIIRHVIREVNDVPYLFGVYGCTPLVRFPLSALKDGAHVHGDVIGELGYGANPVDMLTFTSPADSKDYLLVTTDTRSASQIAVSDLASAPAQPPTDVAHIFPSGDHLPENLLRFYVCFSNSMQRGNALKEISLLDSDGRPVADVQPSTDASSSIKPKDDGS